MGAGPRLNLSGARLERNFGEVGVTAKTQKLVLVVDDEPEITRMLQMMLEYEGYAVRCAHGTAQGIVALEAEAPDLILLDFMMPQMSGLELCSYVRREPRTAHIPVIVYSAAAGDQSVKMAMDAGATLYVSKTVSSEKLLKTVREMLAPDSGNRGLA